ncbi:MAG TPA: hypothetical protein VMH49_01105 [Thermoplasmata archaeon]|nr:hypothetical protein [Thermoplasmata archaeon]
MAGGTDRHIGVVFGLLGALLIALEGLLSVARGVFYLAVSHFGQAYRPFDEALILIVSAIIIGLFSYLGGAHREGRATTAGVVLIVIAVVGWFALGFGSGVLALLGALLTLIGGIVFLIEGR